MTILLFLGDKIGLCHDDVCCNEIETRRKNDTENNNRNRPDKSESGEAANRFNRIDMMSVCWCVVGINQAREKGGGKTD